MMAVMVIVVMMVVITSLTQKSDKKLLSLWVRNRSYLQRTQRTSFVEGQGGWRCYHHQQKFKYNIGHDCQLSPPFTLNDEVQGCPGHLGFHCLVVFLKAAWSFQSGYQHEYIWTSRKYCHILVNISYIYLSLVYGDYNTHSPIVKE